MEKASDTRSKPERRRLLAVLAADIVAYMQLMADDEDDTFDRLKELSVSVINPVATQNHGQIVKWTGNGFIGIFDSAADAVRAAIEIQSALATLDAGASMDRQMRLRIGISAGDVITVPGNVFGDTVNTALRLQSLAAPGNICISRAIRDAVRNKFTIEYEDQGTADPKNAAEPIGAFRVVFDPIAWTMNRQSAPAQSGNRLRLYGALAALVLATGAASGLWFLPRDSSVGSSAAASTLASLPIKIAVPEVKSSAQQAAGTAPVPPPQGASLSSTLASALPALNGGEGEKVAAAYQQAPGHKAQAASLQPPGLWRSSKRESASDAATSALENCQIFYGAPCVLIATDDDVPPMPPGGKWPLHDMPRVHYQGDYDPSQIPGISPETRARSDIVHYLSAPGPKAIALHPTGGRIFTINGASDQRRAEEEVLRKCNSDPERNGKDGSCFLYAAGNQVVLPRRLTKSTAP